MIRRPLYPAERVVGTITVAVGWAVAVQQLVRDGWIEGGGTAWLFAGAAVGTLGLLVVFAAGKPDARGFRALGLVLAAVSPTVFAYPLNALLLVAAVIELAVAVRARHLRTAS